jgi:hypothetical protein
MPITPPATPHTKAIPTVNPPTTTPFNAQTTTVAHVAGIDRGRKRRGSQTNRAVPPSRWNDRRYP